MDTKLITLYVIIGVTLLKAVSHTYPTTGTNSTVALHTTLTNKSMELYQMIREGISKLNNTHRVHIPCQADDNYSSHQSNGCVLCRPNATFNRTQIIGSELRQMDLYNLEQFTNQMEIVHSHEVNFSGSQTNSLVDEFERICNNSNRVVSYIQSNILHGATTLSPPNATCGAPSLVTNNCGDTQFDCLTWWVLRGMEELVLTLANEMSGGQWFV
ncbi:uncharacterized protein [Amphiura filiformis]|uniref:uncharacterized protein n=1 Tax=Amphiura filiformis TaxID=82378 RepID=UPI003B21D2A8